MWARLDLSMFLRRKQRRSEETESTYGGGEIEYLGSIEESAYCEIEAPYRSKLNFDFELAI